MKIDVAIGIGLAAGLAVGLAASVTQWPVLLAIASGVAPVGEAFVNLLQMVVVPLVATTVFVGVAGMGDVRKLGRVGILTLLFFAGATLVSILIGMGMMSLTLPLAGAPPTLPPEQMADVPPIPGPIDFLVGLIPRSPIGAAAEGALLPLMVFTVLFAAAVGTLPGPEREQLMRLAQAVTSALIKLVHWILWVAPVGVFALAAPVTAEAGVGMLRGLVVFVITVVVGLVLFVALVYLPVVSWLGGIRPTLFLRGCVNPQMIAFTTTSSAAAIPAMLESAARLRLSPTTSSLVIPLGAAIGRAGSALFQGAAVIFLAWLFDVQIPLAALSGAVMATGVVSLTVASVPSASVMTLAPALSTVGVPQAGLALLLGVDRIPDMFRTATNVTGHMAAAAVVDRVTTPADQSH